MHASYQDEHLLLGQRLVNICRERPESIAIVDSGQRITYRELLSRASTLASELGTHGVHAGDVVGVAFPRSAGFVIAVAGIVLAGAAYLPVDVTQPAERRRRILTDSSPSIVVSDGSRLDGLPTGITILRLPADGGTLQPLPEQPRPNDPLYVIYTSGSTGAPNGVSVTQYNATRLFDVTRPIYDFTEQDVWAMFHSVAFDVSVWEMWGALLCGGQLVIIPPEIARVADELHRLVLQEQVTVLCQTPGAFRAFDAADAAAGRPLNRLRHIVLAGEALDPRTLAGWFDAHGDDRPQVANMYGPTETTVYATYRRMRTRDARGSGASWIGQPLPDMRIELIGENLKPVANGDVGEIWIGGAGVSTGYVGRPELTRERYRPDPYTDDPDARMYKSGDLARRSKDGDIEYLGRVDQQVKLRGFRIELGEVEAALRTAAGVHDAVVALREDGPAGPRLVAYLVQDRAAVMDAEALRAHAAQCLPEYMVPTAYARIERVPRNANDKIDRSALPAPAADGAPCSAGGEAPRNELEREVANIYGDVLGIAVETREADFFRLGGHSLLAIRVASLCRDRLQFDLPVNAIFLHPDVAGLTDFVRRNKAVGKAMVATTHRPRNATQKLTPQQYALWLEVRLNAEADTYNEAVAFRVALQLTPQRIRRALEQLASTHEILRARLVEQSGEPCFVFDLSAADIAVTDAGNDAAQLRQAMHRPFDLARGPLWRVAFQHDSAGSTALLLVAHHIILDAASEEILLRDFAAACDDPDAVPPARRYGYHDLADREHEQFAIERTTSERYWTEALAGAELTPALPPPCVPAASGDETIAATVRRALPPEVVRSIQARAAEFGATPFIVYFAAYLCLLRIYTGSDDLVAGSPLSLRDTEAAQSVAGYFLNPVPLHVRLAGNLSFRAAVSAVAQGWKQARTHGRLPMHLLLQAAGGGQRTGIGSPFQIFFSLIHDPKAGLRIGGKPLLPLQVTPRHAKFRLFLLVESGPQETVLTLEFQRGTLDPAMAERLLVHMERLLRDATAQPDIRLSMLELMEPAELEQIYAWGTCERPYERDSTVPDIFERVVRQHADSTAIVTGSENISYAALDRRANAVAAALQRAGVVRGDRVPLLLARGPRFIASALGVLKCGAAFVPLDPSYPAWHLARMLEPLGARVGMRAGRPDLADAGIIWLDALCADEESRASAPPRAVGATDAAYVMFTSGSSGMPKAVEIPHRAIVRLVQAQDFAQMGPDEIWLHMAPVSFDASTLEIWAALLHGGCCAVIEDAIPTAHALSAAVSRHGVTSAWLTTSLFNTLIDEAPECLAGIRQILIGGEALSPAHVRRAFERFPGIRLVNGYGPTENTTFTCCHVISRQDVESGHAIPIGQPVANTSVLILSRDSRPTPVGVPGELVAGGDGVALGYVGGPDQPSARFVPDIFCKLPGRRLYRTGDRARWRPDGVLEFLGRMDDQVKIRGYRVEPQEVAIRLNDHPQVKQTVVVARKAPAGTLQLVAYVVPQDDTGTEKLPQTLAVHAAQHLPSHMHPARFVIARNLPRKPNGKIDLEALDLAIPHAADGQRQAALSPLEAALLAIWREVLDNPELEPEDDFFQCGGDSLLAVRMLARVERELDVTIAARALIEGRTARGFAALVAGITHTRLPLGVVLVRKGAPEERPPLFCLPGLGGGALQFQGLVAKLSTPRTVYAIEPHDLDVEDSVLESLVETASVMMHRMREVQPAGPYSILGYSYGGNLAVEVARLLSEQGEKVAVTLLDAYAPGSIRNPSGIRKIARHLRILWRLRMHEVYAYLVPRIRRRLGLRTAPQPSIPVPESEFERRLARARELGLRAFHSYKPTPFNARILLVHATDLEDWMEIVDPSGTCGWGAVCRGGVDLIRIGCKHLELFSEPHISDLAWRLNEALNSAPPR